MAATVPTKPVSGTRRPEALNTDSLGATHRRDAWWVGPLLTGIVLAGFGIYGTGRAIYNAEYDFGHGARSASVAAESHAYLLSPFYSPLIILPWLPAWISPAFLILWAPGGFRVSCYYYRKAYYRAFFLDPPGCAVGEGRRKYAGETRLFLFQNLHRYFLYVAIVFLVILAIDVVHAAIWPAAGAGGGWTVGCSVGTLVLLSLYTFSCHSFRHLVGGNVDCFSCVSFGAQRYQAWKGVSFLNQRHMLFAWISLFGVGLTDLYVWMVASGRITDIRLF